MTDQAAAAFVHWGSLDHWTGTRTRPLDGIGITLGHGSWPIWHQDDATTTLRVWPNPAHWDEHARFGTVPAWALRTGHATPGGRLTPDRAARSNPAVIPWNPSWSGAGGTQWERADNGVIVAMRDGTAWTIQGSRPGHIADAIAITARTLRLEGWALRAAVTKPGDMVADAIRHIAPGITQRGSQGPISKLDGLLRPHHLAGPWGHPVRLVGFNVAHGPGATAAPGGWVEHPGRGERARAGGLPVALPEGPDPRMVRPFTLLRLDISDQGIDAWLDAEGVTDPVLRTSKAWFAVGLRDRGMRLAETGTGSPILESSGGINPAERQAWADRGIRTDHDARTLGAGLFTHGRLYDASELAA